MDMAQSNRAMWRGAAIPATTSSIFAMILAWFLAGTSGLFGALLASFTVVIFFSISLLVARFT